MRRDSLLETLETLKAEHRVLDGEIEGLLSAIPINQFSFNQLRMQRLKKRKLQLRDRISFLEGQLYPDIIA